MSKATPEALDQLHATLATALKDSLYTKDAEGNKTLNASVASVARQFLKDNFVSADASIKQSPLGALAGMPEFDEEGNVTPLRKATG